ncbi:MAG: 2-amino-4-hydroxy-6-hydroxymethyldihydropteridine diphosphokinase [Erythrobacter sp.]
MNALYLIGLGSNMRHPRIGSPRHVIGAGAGAMVDAGLDVLAISKAISSRPLGPSQRTYTNAVAAIEAELSPPDLLELLHDIEDAFGRSRIGQRWRSRTLDLDILLWSGGIWQSADLQIPHPEMARRDFVIGPAAQIAGEWRHPLLGLTLNQINARLIRPN